MGRKMGVAGLVEEFAVEVQALAHELRTHDERELGLLDWNRRAVEAIGPRIEAGEPLTVTQLKIWRALAKNTERLVAANTHEDSRLHAPVLGLVAS